MIGKLIKYGLLLVIGVLGYNYFFGDASEKANSEKIFTQVKEVAVSVGDMVKDEKQKFDAGKYDKALDKLGNAYKSVREKISGIDKGLLDKIDALELRKTELQQEMQEASNTDNVEKEAELKGKMEQLVKDSESLFNLLQHKD